MGLITRVYNVSVNHKNIRYSPTKELTHRNGRNIVPKEFYFIFKTRFPMLGNYEFLYYEVTQ